MQHNHNKVRYIWIPFLILFILIPAGFYYVDWSKSGEGAGLYSQRWQPDPLFAYWNPDNFYASVQTMGGKFKGEDCVQCHRSVTPGIVNDWQKSRHSQTEKTVYCSDCHGNNHQDLHMPTPDVCANCHRVQHAQFEDEKRYGFPSHALAMERALDANHFVDKPKAEVTACLQCHSIANKCDSCHSRHRFSVAEARRPEACVTCHSGPPHPDDETYFASAHGQIYLNEGENWDWSKPLTKGNYKVPTCAYCHMDNGKHQVANKSIYKFGIKQENPLASANEVKRKQWLQLCDDCHDKQQATRWLAELDKERKQAWEKLYAAEDTLKELRQDDLIYPAAEHRPAYPNQDPDSIWQRERIGFFEGQASAFYNVSPIERDYFEMWYFNNLSAYKASAHGDYARVTQSHALMDKDLVAIKRVADKLRQLGKAEQNTGVTSKPELLWLKGEYTEHNREHN